MFTHLCRRTSLASFIMKVSLAGSVVYGATFISLGHAAPPSTEPQRKAEPKDKPKPEIDPKIAELLKTLKTSKQAKEKVAALKSLGEFGEKARDAAGMAVAAEILNRLESVNLAARSALDRIDPDVFEHCNVIMSGAKPEDRVKAIAAVSALKTKGKSAVPLLIWVVNNRTDEAIGACHALYSIAPDLDTMQPLFIQWTKHKDFRVREVACLGLSKLEAGDTKKSVKALIVALSDKERSVRYWAATSLGAMGKEAADAEDALRKTSTDSDKDVREAAQAAIKKVQEK